jgi:hypothetical protein
VGIEGSALNGAVGSLHVVTTIGALPNTDEAIDPSRLPYAVTIAPPADNLSAAVAVRVEGFTDPGWTPGSGVAPILVRTAETHFAEGRQALLRVTLQPQCLLAISGSPLSAPRCLIPQTCIDGQCADDTVAASGLEAYTPDWARANDICDPGDAGPPSVQVGSGQTDFTPADGGQTLQVEQGPQGGHHVWLAVRQRNLEENGSTTVITSVQPGSALQGPTMTYAFAFVPDAPYCKLFGLRYQLDVSGTDYHLFLGQPIDVTVTITDPKGASAAGTAHFNISAQALCPSGVAGCP